MKLKNRGITFDEALVRQTYKNLSPLIKQKAETILLPIAGEVGVVYGMNNLNGNITPFSFSRASSATRFSDPATMQLVDTNIPRIDFGNYSNSAKILIEKQSTNIAPCSNDFSVGQWAGSPAVLREQVSYKASGYKYYWKIEKGQGSANEGITTPVGQYTTGNFYTARVYLRKGNSERTFVGINFVGNTWGSDEYSTARIIKGTGRIIGKIGGLVRIEGLSDEDTIVEITRSVNPNIETSDYIYINIYPDDYTSTTPGNNNLISSVQLEANSSTSYIPTNGSAVTRSADLLTYNLANNCSVYMKTTKQEVILDKQAGTWNIHEDLDNEGIITISIFNNILSNKEKLELFKNASNEEKLKGIFFPSVISDGGIIYKDLFLSNYNNLSDEDKKSDAIIIPGTYKSGTIYALSKDFSFSKLNFSRASSATRFNSPATIQLVDANIPRIDFGNYSDNAKILIERQSANRAIYSNDFTAGKWGGAISMLRELTETKALGFEYYWKFEKASSSSNETITNGMGIDSQNNNAYSLRIHLRAGSSTRIGAGLYFYPTTLGWGQNNLSSARVIKGNATLTQSSGGRWNISNLSDQDSIVEIARLVDPDLDTPTSVYIYLYTDTSTSTVVGASNLASGVQVEALTGSTSYIPTNGSAVTRSADLLAINLESESTVKLKTTKQETMINKTVGIWNIHEDLENEGIYSIVINKKQTV